jgi:hypothetical protein
VTPTLTPTLRRAAPVLGPIAIFLAATALHVVALWPARLVEHRSISSLLMKWDSAYYLSLAHNGYPTHLPPGAHTKSVAGFYPLYPLLERIGFDVTPFGDHAVALGVAIAMGAAAMVVLWQLANKLTDRETAYRAVTITAFAPGAIVLSMGYSESTLLFFAAACLWMLRERRWVLAGVFAAFACLARPNGIATAVACLVAAIVALRADRHDRKPLIAPVIAALGAIALPLYDLIHLGDAFAYFKTQKRGWNEGFDFGLNTTKKLAGLVVHPTRDFNQFFAGLAIALLIGGLVLVFLWKPPAEIIAYSVTIAVLTFGASSFASTFRLLLVGLPFWIAYARVLKNNTYAVVLASSAVLFAALAYASTTVIYTP